MFLFILGLSLAFFGVYFFVPNFVGFDSYYYLNSICLGTDLSRGLVETLIFSVLPCNFFALKLIQCLLMALTLWIIGKTIALYYPKQVNITILSLLGLTPIFFYMFFKFENDIFAYPFLALSVFFFYLSKKQNFKLNTILSLGFLGISASIYKLTAYFLLIGSVSNPIFLILSIFSFPYWIGMIGFNLNIAEEVPIIGLITLGFLYCFIKIHSKKETLISLILVALQGQFNIFIPFIFCLNIAKSINFVEDKFKEKLVLAPIIITAVIGLLLISTLPLIYYPNESDIKLIQTTIQDYNSQEILNDFELGYIMQGYGYNTPYFSSLPNPDFNNIKTPYMAITKIPLDCSIIQQNKHYKVYKCNQ